MTSTQAEGRADAIVVRGHPSNEELAALSAALMALLSAAADQPDEAPRPVSSQGWRSRSRQLRLRPSPGHGAWKASVRRD